MPIVVDSTILVYAVAASVQRVGGESTMLSWCAVGFFTAVSVAANAAHVLAPNGVPVAIDGTVIFGAFLAAIMPVSLFFATKTTVQLAVAPPVGSVSQRRKRAQARLVQERGGQRAWTSSGQFPDQQRGSVVQLSGPVRGPRMDHPSRPARTKAEVNPERILELAEQKLSQRATAQQLGTSKTTVARVLAEHAEYRGGSSGKVAALAQA
ncbi:helix-turn-helix domain-containing protein [Pseudarthrobacter sp. SORGH_AS 212]|uniref:helix-turn-helix domain-containing protein n=1 Tax=Pseudarthrobacter sp. SORGH_AS 212 TaxID=3041777 RepID=UPI0032B81D8C